MTSMIQFSWRFLGERSGVFFSEPITSLEIRSLPVLEPPCVGAVEPLDGEQRSLVFFTQLLKPRHWFALIFILIIAYVAIFTYPAFPPPQMRWDPSLTTYQTTTHICMIRILSLTSSYPYRLGSIHNNIGVAIGSKSGGQGCL